MSTLRRQAHGGFFVFHFAQRLFGHVDQLHQHLEVEAASHHQVIGRSCLDRPAQRVYIFLANRNADRIFAHGEPGLELSLLQLGNRAFRHLLRLAAWLELKFGDGRREHLRHADQKLGVAHEEAQGSTTCGHAVFEAQALSLQEQTMQIRDHRRERPVEGLLNLRRLVGNVRETGALRRVGDPAIDESAGEIPAGDKIERQAEIEQAGKFAVDAHRRLCNGCEIGRERLRRFLARQEIGVAFGHPRVAENHARQGFGYRLVFGHASRVLSDRSQRFPLLRFLHHPAECRFPGHQGIDCPLPVNEATTVV